MVDGHHDQTGLQGEPERPSVPGVLDQTAFQGQPNITFSEPSLGDRLPYLAPAMMTVQQSSSWQGPYPSPDAVERFEAILPGAFNRILTMAEKTQDSQIRTTENAQRFLRVDVMRSHYLGAAISVLAVVCSTICGLAGHPTVAVALVGIPVMAVARAFLANRSDNDNVTKDDNGEVKPAANNRIIPE